MTSALSADEQLLFHILAVPYNYTERLSKASVEDLKDCRLIGGGIGIHFDKIDEDISLEGIIRDFGDETKRIKGTSKNPARISEGFTEKTLLRVR